MYDLDTPQPEDSFRDCYELGPTEWPPTDERELARLDRMTDNAEADYAFACGWCPFDRESASEFLARQQTPVEV